MSTSEEDVLEDEDGDGARELEFPLFCPREADNWNLHPRVYLTPNDDGVAVCPYCGKQYPESTS